MVRGSIIAAVALICLMLADQHFHNGRYTDITITMLSAMKDSFRL
jgi:hypothetical protein